MIISNQQIAIHWSKLRNLSSMNSGRYFFRISLTETMKKQQIKATPVCIIEQLQSKLDNRSEFDDQQFVTKIVPLKSSANIDISQVYVFKLNSPQTSSKQDSILNLKIEQVTVEMGKQRLVATYNGIMANNAEHQYLEVDFYENAPCQLVCSFHRCQYKFELKSEEQTVDLKTFCQKYYSNKLDEITQYFINQGIRNYRSLIEHSSILFKQEAQIDCVEVEEPIPYKVSQSVNDLWEIDTEIGSNQDDQIRYNGKKRRSKIFSITRGTKNQKYFSIEKNMHQNAQKIYQVWRELLQKLTSPLASGYIKEKTEAYRKKLVQKTKESVSSFKGSWDTELYGDEGSMRQKLASQLRNQHKQFEEEHPSVHSDFPIMNKAFFSENRPIIFEEKATKSEKSEEKGEVDLMIFLVHGLGACRLDMEKLKVELRRYYDKKVRVYISSANEGRTQGEIDNMGMRLASEVDYQLSKISPIPKICMVGHSMGGLIIRSALPRLQKFKKHFHSMVTLSSPHLGYNYSASKLVDVGLWFMNAVKKCTSIKQMNMCDHEEFQKTFLYRLSQKPGLQWFKKVTFLGSHQDSYVPYYSARIQKHKESIMDSRGQVKKGIIHCKMADNILSHAKASIMRLDVDFSIPEQNLDNLIGRAAHINFINNTEMVRTFVLAGSHYFF